MGKLVKLIGSGIGLAAEAIAARRSPSPGGASSSRRTAEDAPPAYVDLPDERADQLIANGQAIPVDHRGHQGDDENTESDEHELDEEVWELDEAGDAYSGPENTLSERQQGVDELVQTFLNQNPPPYDATRGRLPCPVIIPQRRPKDKSRGFVHVYAPVLLDCGIDQTTFLDFLKTFHKASQASPVYTVINMAAVGAGFVPEVAAQVTSALVQVAVGVAKGVQVRQRTNSFLDQMNDKLFRPNGLFALIMTHKPEQKADHEQIDISKAIAKSITPAESKMREQMKHLKLSSGKTYGELEMVASAPLIFPALDAAAAAAEGQGGKKQSSLNKGSKFVANYLDRRAQASYASENPNSSLAADQTEAQFASRYSDPNHPASSGSLVALVTGGAMQGGRARRRERVERRTGRPLGRENGEKKGKLRRLLQQDVLYLMIVNMPTDEEIEAARAQLTAK